MQKAAVFINLLHVSNFLTSQRPYISYPHKKLCSFSRVLIRGYYQQLKNGSLRIIPDHRHLSKMKNKTSQSQERRTHLFYFSLKEFP